MQQGIRNHLGLPLISVVIPAYNVSAYIDEALRSVFLQDFKAYEVIVVNDGSTDTSELETVLEPYRDKIRYIRQENRGLAATRNVAIRAARGKFIALLDADDIWCEGKLTEQLAFMKHGEFDMVYADALLIGDVPWPKGTTFMDRSPSEGPVTVTSLLDMRHTPVVSTVIMRKDLVEEVGAFDEEDRDIFSTEDFDLWLRLARAGARIGYEKKTRAEYRFRSDSLSADSIKLHEATLSVLEKTRRTMTLSAGEKEALDRTERRLQSITMLERSKIMILNGEIAEARETLAKAREANNSWKIPLALLVLRMFPGLVRRYVQTRQR
jgi:glycosyltransferase involved in cell wall biosynthesis